MAKLPGGPLARRPLHFIWIADCSGSMGYGGKIQSLNNAIREALPHMQDAAAENPNAEVKVRAVKFSSGASWHAGSAVPVEQFRWDDLEANGVTDMGKALQLVAEQLDPEIMPQRALPPVLVLISDGHPTDDVSAGLRDLMAQPWGTKGRAHRYCHRRRRREKRSATLHRPPGTGTAAGQQCRKPGQVHQNGYRRPF